MKVSYPLNKINKSNVEGYLGSSNIFGKYPISAQNTWHGGIHMEQYGKDNNSILNVADGRIIAYRINEEDEVYQIDDRTIKYSSSFILIQHDYKSEKGQKITFYSLYHNLKSISSSENSEEIPKFMRKLKNLVVVKENFSLDFKGLNVRILEKDIITTVKKVNGNNLVIPNGTKIEAQVDEFNKIVVKRTNDKLRYIRVKFTGADNFWYDNVYVYLKSLTDNKDGTYTVKSTNDDPGKYPDTRTEEEKKVKGARVRETIGGKIVAVIPHNQEVVIEDNSNKEWLVIEGYKGFSHKTNFKKTYTIDESKITLNKITADDIPVKAGEVIGHIGKFGFFEKLDYQATHLEIFTPDEVTDFLENKNKDGEDKKFFTLIKKDTKLQPNLPPLIVDVKKNTPIKVLNIEGDYAQIKITSITATLMRDSDINDNEPPFTTKGLYTIKNLANVNKFFNGLATKDTTFTKTQIKLPKNWKTELKREVTFYPKEYNKTFWVEKTAITKITEKVAKELSYLQVLEEKLLDVSVRPEFEIFVRDAKTGDKTTTSKEICTAYKELPNNNAQETTVTEDIVLDLRKSKKKLDQDKNIWYKIAINSKEHGWLQIDDNDKFSAYNWNKFGFKAVNDDSNNYIYSVKDVNGLHDTNNFIKTIWDTIDKKDATGKKDKKLTINELITAFSNPKKVKKITRLVCKHKSEWSYSFDDIKKEIKQLKLFDYGINLEKDDEKKKKLEQERDTILEKLEPKVKNLMWWNEASKLTYTKPVEPVEPTPKPKYDFGVDPEPQKASPSPSPTPQKDVVPLATKTTAPQPDTNPTGDEPVATKKEEKDQPPERMFPSPDIVHHFHPIAWVTQMKRVFGNFKTIKKGDRGKIVEELNIRLAGFGGSIPTDIFTNRTEKVVSQFQKDYMGITPTGEVTSLELNAIDSFSNKFDISDKFWEQIKCSCSTKGSVVTSKLRGKAETNKCKGFGDHTGKKTYRKSKAKNESYHMYEYPGIHRSLLFAIKALQFYFSKQSSYKIDHITSGYRCRFKNYVTTNHQGKAIDIQFSKGDWKIRFADEKNLKPLKEIRDNFYIKKLGAQEKWSNPNIFSTEPIDLKYNSKGKPRFDHTFSWIHMDVRTFNSIYLKDQFFCTNRSSLNKQSITSMSSEVEEVEYKWAHSTFAHIIAEQESNNNYNLCNNTKNGLKVVRDINVVETSIKDIQAKQKSRVIFAVGRYQLIPTTLQGAINSLNLDINQNLDEQTQDKIFQEYLITIKRPQIIEYLEKEGDISSAMYAAAKEWASIGVEKGKKISKERIAKGDESYYAGDGFNKAHITSIEFKNALIESKK